MSQEPDFRAFKDWRVDGPAGPWPYFYEPDTELTVEQKKIVEKNAKLLLDRDAWSAHVDAFEEQLALIKNKKKRSRVRAKFQIRFDHHIFPDHKADFFGIHFPCSVSFTGAKFGGYGVSFDGARFEDGSVSFNGATFGDGHVWFDGATFGKGNVSFEGITFGKGDVSFKRVKFGEGNVWFDDFTFGDGNISFKDATFGEGNVWFIKVTLTKASVSFEDIAVAGNLFVRNISFPKEANFQRASVKGTADFSENTFHEVPDFRDTVFARPPEVARMEVLPYAFTFMTPWWKGEYDEAAKFRKLKAMALASNDHEKDGEFFAYEMLAKRGDDKDNKSFLDRFIQSPFDLLINWFYFTLSNFGQSYLRPLVCLLISLVVFIAPYFWMVRSFLPTSEALWFGFDHSWRNFMPLLNSLFRFAYRPENHETPYEKSYNALIAHETTIDCLITLGIAQNFIGLILLFLLLLGLRNKFRLK
ncbi:MAG: pentapeptide repeat-containing protein [Hyphomicrobiales bacterium]